MRQLSVLVFAGLFGAACAACTGTSSGIDGWVLGQRVDCTRDARCKPAFEVAVIGLDQIAPQHDAVVAFALYEDGRPIARSGGPLRIVLMRLGDGGQRAIGVGTVGVGGLVPFLAHDQPLWPGGSPQSCPEDPTACPSR